MLRGHRSRESDQEEVESLTSSSRDFHCDDDEPHHSKNQCATNLCELFSASRHKPPQVTTETKLKSQSEKSSRGNFPSIPIFFQLSSLFSEHRYMVLWCLYVQYYSIITAIYAISAVKINMQEITRSIFGMTFFEKILEKNIVGS